MQFIKVFYNFTDHLAVYLSVYPLYVCLFDCSSTRFLKNDTT